MGGAGGGGGAALVERILCIFREGILPLRRECQLAYLLERLQGLHVAYLGTYKARTPFYRASTKLWKTKPRLTPGLPRHFPMHPKVWTAGAAGEFRT